MDGWA